MTCGVHGAGGRSRPTRRRRCRVIAAESVNPATWRAGRATYPDFRVARTQFSDESQRIEAQLITDVRRFNRRVTERAGALDEGFLGRGRSLGQSRVLWE